MTVTSDEIKACVRRYFEEVWNQKDESAIARYSSPDSTAEGNDPDFGKTADVWIQQWRKWHAAFPDLHFAVNDVIVEGEMAVSRWTITGTHTGARFMGADPAGVAIKVDGVSCDRIRDGRIVEGADYWDALGLRRQLGVYQGE